MMKKINEMRELQKKKGKKGFSMIELIIVIAIMAILIALIGTQLIPYLEKSRQNKDLTTLDTCLTNFQSAAASTETTLSTGGTYVISSNGIKPSGGNVDSVLTASFEEFAGYSCSDVAGLFKSSKGKSGTYTEVTIDVDSKGALTAYMGDLMVSAKKSGINS